MHRVRMHLKVPGWLSDLNAHRTREFTMFLSRLNEKWVVEKICV